MIRCVMIRYSYNNTLGLILNLGLTHGPQFFERQNYKGKSKMLKKSISNVKTSGVLENRMISSVKVRVRVCDTRPIHTYNYYSQSQFE